MDFVTPLRERTQDLLADPAELDRILADGAGRARGIASATLADVYAKVGFLPPAPTGPQPAEAQPTTVPDTAH